ncbi:hypothetical protein [Nocardia sp. NPDC058497]|uniref:hypothetical protein n=1 Tax=Nocardia sp. NPDC058497 TaxID=3346529 RepID=UPI00365078C6
MTPLLMCLGMAFAYLGAFHQPTPNHLELAVVGDSPQSMVLAQTMKDKAGDGVDIITVPTREDIILIGIGLHTFLKLWTTLALITLFVMLNFTTSGGVYGPQLQNGFFGALHSFWNGADFVEGLRSLLYFDTAAGFGARLLGLFAWLAVGVVLVVVAGRHEARNAPAPVARAAVEEEIGESVAV